MIYLVLERHHQLFRDKVLYNQRVVKLSRDHSLGNWLTHPTSTFKSSSHFRIIITERILYFSTYQINKGTAHKTSRIRSTINNPKFHSNSTDRINFGFSVSSLPAFFPSMHLQHLNWNMRKESETTSIFIRTSQCLYRALWYILLCFISHSWEAVHGILFFLTWPYFILKMNDRKATFRLNSSWKTKVYINPNMKGKKRKEETGGMRREKIKEMMLLFMEHSVYSRCLH